MNTARPLLFAALALLACFAPAAQAQDAGLTFDSRRRVFWGRDVPKVPAFKQLDDRIRLFERGQSFTYYVAILSQTETALEQQAQDLVRRWRAHPRFFPERAYVVVCEASGARVHLVFPSPVRDRLALTPQWLSQQTRPYENHLEDLPREERLAPAGLSALAREVGDLLEGLERRVANMQRERDARRLRQIEERADRAKALAEEAHQVSSEIMTLELRAARLRAREIPTEEADRTLREARLAFARVQDALGQQAGPSRPDFDPSAAADALSRTRQRLAEAAISLDEIERAREQFATQLSAAQGKLQRLEVKIEEAVANKQHSNAELRRLRDQVRQARRALIEGERDYSERRPVEALRNIEGASAELASLERALAPPPEPAAPPAADTDSGVWAAALAVLFGLPLLVVVLGHFVHYVRRSELLDQAEEQRESTQRLASALREEVLALRKLYLQALKPPGVVVPDSLLPQPPPVPRRFQGVTGNHLAEAQAQMEDLHSLWRGLEISLFRHGVERSEDAFYDLGPLRRCVRTLNDAPARNLPVSRIRACASALERVARSSASAEGLLEECAHALRAADAWLEQVLQAGFSTHSFDDDYADLAEKALEAALHASADPVRSCRLAQQAVRIAEALGEKVRRTLEVAEAREGLIERLDEPLSPGEDPSELEAWSWELIDRVGRHLDEGSREQAKRELERASALAEDAAAITLGEAPFQPDFEALREELHQAHLGLKELSDGFARTCWEDLESDLHRAAARIELLGEGSSAASARVGTIQRAFMAISVRQLALQGQRERGASMIDELEARVEGLRNFVAREERAVPFDTAAAVEGLANRLRRVRSSAYSEEPADWEALLLELFAIEKGLASLRGQAGEDVLRYHRAYVLRKSVKDKVATVERILSDERRGKRPGAQTRLNGARAAHEASTQLLESGDHVQAMLWLQEGVRAAYDAQGIGLFHGGRERVADRGILGDAQFAILIALQRLGEANRLYQLGLTGDAGAAWELLSDARAQLAAYAPSQALQLAEQATQAASEAVVAGRLKLIKAEDDARLLKVGEAELHSAARARGNELSRTAERQRRARYEILALDEDPDLEEVDVDLDAEDAEEEEALEQATEEPKPQPSTVSGWSGTGSLPPGEDPFAVPGATSTPSEKGARDTVAPQPPAPQPPAPQPDAPQPDGPGAEDSAEEPPAATTGAESASDASVESPTGDDATSTDATSDSATSDDANSDDANSSDATSSDATSSDAPSDDATGDDANSTDATSTDANSTDANSTDANSDDSTSTDAASDDATSDDSETEEAAAVAAKNPGEDPPEAPSSGS